MAETVMVSIGEQGLQGEPDAGFRFCFSAIESGVMDVFFNAGHIIFNDENFRTSEDQYRTVRIAREGGAVSVLFIDCIYDPDSRKAWQTADSMPVSIPRRIVLKYIKTGDFGVSKSMEIAPSQTEAAKYSAIEDYYALLGKKAAESILKK
jgi:hypothetical protein